MSSISHTNNHSPRYSLINLRIEGSTTTIYEGPIYSGPRNVTTPSGGTHLYDGTNGGANPTPGNTPTDALATASELLNLPFDGTFDTAFDDFFITSIGPDTETSTEFWGLLLNYQFTPVGGCQQEVVNGDKVLWAYNAFNLIHFLEVSPAEVVVRKGGNETVRVVDGTTGSPVQGATIAGVTTDGNGDAVLVFETVGVFKYKATAAESLRSNALIVTVV